MRSAGSCCGRRAGVRRRTLLLAGLAAAFAGCFIAEEPLPTRPGADLGAEGDAATSPCAVAGPLYADADHDGFGRGEIVDQGCASPGFAQVDGDCDDQQPLVFPGASETCDCLDNDCDGRIDGRSQALVLSEGGTGRVLAPLPKQLFEQAAWAIELEAQLDAAPGETTHLLELRVSSCVEAPEQSVLLQLDPSGWLTATLRRAGESPQRLVGDRVFAPGPWRRVAFGLDGARQVWSLRLDGREVASLPVAAHPAPPACAASLSLGRAQSSATIGLAWRGRLARVRAVERAPAGAQPSCGLATDDPADRAFWPLEGDGANRVPAGEAVALPAGQEHFGPAIPSAALLDGDGDGPSACGGDCAADDAQAGPGSVEACNGRDDDCDGQLDEGCDDDGDGWCDLDLPYQGWPAPFLLVGSAQGERLWLHRCVEEAVTQQGVRLQQRLPWRRVAVEQLEQLDAGQLLRDHAVIVVGPGLTLEELRTFSLVTEPEAPLGEYVAGGGVLVLLASDADNGDGYVTSVLPEEISLIPSDALLTDSPVDPLDPLVTGVGLGGLALEGVEPELLTLQDHGHFSRESGEMGEDALPPGARTLLQRLGTGHSVAFEARSGDGALLGSTVELCPGDAGSGDGVGNEVMLHNLLARSLQLARPAPLSACPLGAGDCNDTLAATHPGAGETLCDAQDNDCDPATPDTAAETGAAHCDGLDQDCDEATDEGCDLDGDRVCGPGPGHFAGGRLSRLLVVYPGLGRTTDFIGQRRGGVWQAQSFLGEFPIALRPLDDLLGISAEALLRDHGAILVMPPGDERDVTALRELVRSGGLLDRFVRAGGALWVDLGGAPAALDVVLAPGNTSLGEERSFGRIAQADPAHPVLSGVGLGSLPVGEDGLRGWPLHARGLVRPGDPPTPILRGDRWSEGDPVPSEPLLIEYPLGRGQVIVSALDLFGVTQAPGQGLLQRNALLYTALRFGLARSGCPLGNDDCDEIETPLPGQPECVPGVGVCAVSLPQCRAWRTDPWRCVSPDHEAVEQTLDDRLDNDCDGATDEP